MSEVTTRSPVRDLQAAMLFQPQYVPLTEHSFHGGMYCRQVWRPATCLIVGKVHRKEHFYLVAKGTVLITTDDGAQEITGPQVLKCAPGTKRAVYAVTDALCMTFHATSAKTVEEWEAEAVEPDDTSPFLPGNLLPVEQLT